MIATNIIPMLYYIYIVLATKKERVTGTVNKICMTLPAFCMLLLIIPTHLTKWVIYFDENRVYHHGPMMYTVYGIVFLYLLFALAHTIYRRRTLTQGQKVVVYVYTISSIGAVALQLVIPNLMIIHFAIALCIMLIYLSLENPSDYSDKVLGVYNKQAFEAVIYPHLNRNRHFEVAGIQIEGLRYIGETMGAQNVDMILKQIAEYLVMISGARRVFYLTGYQFAIVSDEKKIDLKAVTEMIQQRFADPFYNEAVEISLSVKICILSYPENVRTMEDVVDMMEYLLEDYEASGSDTVLYGNEEFLKKGRRENQILQILKQAIRENYFEVYYQPIYSVKEKRFLSAEALIRLQYKELGFISPEEFIPLAEQNGLILEIGEFVFRQVCRFIKEERLWERGINYIDVNLSVVQCMQEKLYETLLGIMDEYGLPYSCISLEITETAAVMSGDKLWNNMQKLIEKGIFFSMDDYGTGFSNTASIIKYPFHMVKLDKSMLWSAMEDEKAMCALKHTSLMIKDMNMELLAEGVETLEQAQLLEKMGCDLFQGYYYAKPMCGKEFLEKI
jgi:EAL domain-containing protein (putative c-di-GMP-specific phosphodiesterase class I)/GGDEF domain-containing protein